MGESAGFLNDGIFYSIRMEAVQSPELMNGHLIAILEAQDAAEKGWRSLLGFQTDKCFRIRRRIGMFSPGRGTMLERFEELFQSFQRTDIPVLSGLHHICYAERRIRRGLWQTLLAILYYEPLLKTQCVRAGRNLRLIGGLPLLKGGPLRLIIGDNVTLSGATTFIGSKALDPAALEIGNGTYIGYQTVIVAGRGVHIGRHVLIANRVFIAADDGYSAESIPRYVTTSSSSAKSKTVWIDDAAWVGEGATILKGVRVGEGGIVAARAVVTKDVPPYTVVAGNPAKVVKELPVPDPLRRDWSEYLKDRMTAPPRPLPAHQPADIRTSRRMAMDQSLAMTVGC